jgi:hypothetical protein
MHAATVSALGDYYTDLFGIDHATLWQGVTVRTHTGRLQDYEGYYVAWRGDGAHVSMPPSGGSAYAIDEQTAIKVVDGSVEVVSEGQWAKFGS